MTEQEFRSQLRMLAERADAEYASDLASFKAQQEQKISRLVSAMNSLAARAGKRPEAFARLPEYMRNTKLIIGFGVSSAR